MMPSREIERRGIADLQAALTLRDVPLTAEQVAALCEFIERAGGIDKARAALQTLQQLRPAA